jgi:large conductance mechanosensitive channel
MGFVKEFKEFAMRGNLVDMAIGVIMATAFGKVISSFIDGMVMPLIGKVVSGVDFNKMVYELSAAETDATGKVLKEAVSIKYGAFITQIIDFTLVALVVFMFIKMMNRMKRKAEAEAPAPAPPAPTKEELLLTEIRDLLKK